MTTDTGDDPTPFEFSLDGRRFAGLDWGGDGTPLVFLHAAGFCAGMYDPIARQLAGSAYHAIGFDLRGHGRTDPPVESGDYSFAALAEDVVRALGELDVSRAYLVGSSLGGGVAVWVNTLAPDLVLHAVLAEAVVFDLQPLQAEASPLAEQTRRRRVNWPSRAEMFASYGSRPPLDAIEPSALAAYLRYGAVDRADGTVDLACDPAVEAGFYERATENALSTAAELPGLAGKATVVCGAHTSLGLGRFRRQAEELDAELVVLEAGHLVLHEDSDRAAALIAERCRPHGASSGEERSAR